MQKRVVIFTVYYLLFAASWCFGGVAKGADLKNVLILHSYNSGLSWTDNINRGIFDTFRKEFHRTVDLRAEYLDAKHFEQQQYFENYKDYLAKKYHDIKIDLVICADNAAFDFLVEHSQKLFGPAPVLFCGLNYCDTIPTGFTGILEDVDYKSNFSTILKLHPNYNKLYIVNDRSITGKSLNKEMSKVINASFPKLKYEMLTDYTLEELEQKLASLQKNDVVLMQLFNFDRIGRAISYDIILDEVMPHCKVPMYGLWDFYLGKGIVGGTLSNGYDHGVRVSEMAKEILAGKAVSEIPVESGPTKNAYDYKVISHFDIDKSLLPNNAEFINLPYEFISKNRLFFTLLAIIFVLFIILIIVLLYINQRSKITLHKEREYSETIEQKSQELAKALEKVEIANKLKTSFLCNLSHEIRTPMNGILGFTSLLESDDEISNQKEYIDIINTNVKNLLVVINDIIEMSHIESHQVRVERARILINDVLYRCVNEFQYFAEQKDITIFIEDQLPVDESVVVSDEAKLYRVFSNLLSNAIKFSNHGDIKLGYKKEGTHFLFYCKDEGIGIYPQNMDLIFEPFRKIESPNNKLYGGNGLGLAISKAHVELLGGKMWVDSTPNRGSTFYFTLPQTLLN